MAAEIESAMPDFVVLPDRSALMWFEMAHAACNVLGLTELHAEHCLEPRASDELFLEKAATSAEAILTAVRAWLVEHEVPVLSTWFECVSAGGSFLHFSLAGTNSTSFRDDDDD